MPNMILDCERCTAEHCAECVDGSEWRAMKSCATCAHHLGGGDCRLGVEKECGEGGMELWEENTNDRS